jgi:hypothetical protein
MVPAKKAGSKQTVIDPNASMYLFRKEIAAGPAAALCIVHI